MVVCGTTKGAGMFQVQATKYSSIVWRQQECSIMQRDTEFWLAQTEEAFESTYEYIVALSHNPPK